MNRPDDLHELWKTQPVDPVIKGEEMRKIIMKRAAAFDGAIRRRNRRESFAALLVAVFFAIAAWKGHNGIERLGSAIIVAGALWIVYYLRRHGTEVAEPNPDQTLAGYQRALVLKFDHQIRLQRSVKFWYLAPMYIGLLTGTAGLLKETAEKRPLTWMDAGYSLFYTLVFAAVWWWNEVFGVRKLREARTKVICGMEEDERPCRES
jgi:hypothetical protein